MALRRRGGVFHYDFVIDGRRYRGTTKEKTASKARMIEAALINDAKQSRLSISRRSMRLKEFSQRFLQWINDTQLETNQRSTTAEDGRCLRLLLSRA